jgi:hypothetical protein
MIRRPELSFVNNGVAELPKLGNATALHSHQPRRLVVKPISLVVSIANTEDIQIRVTNECFVFLVELSPNVSVPRRYVDMFVSK